MTEPIAPALPALDSAARTALFTEARTANTFSDTPVTDAELTQIWDLARWAPTAANTQPLRVLFVGKGEGRTRLVGHMDEGNKAKTEAAPAVAVLAVDTRFHEHVPTLLPFKPELAGLFEADAELRADTGAFNSALQAGYFVLAVRSVGLAAGPMGGFDRTGVDSAFFPDGRWRSLLVVNIGHPGEDAWRERLPRLAHEDVVRWA
ncbi:3-hydroxypropanoate dehydrogenase [Nocardia amikacinitolerans]|uniref:malonic semialdehyde reductase n=1 Tax=Nocardia amikacinitolerans TaxID=756689 RepID=UPI0008303E80|nr:malonic semialdehyde reductase [Nocardia amikacinitolerans]MCP2321254.1 3-hydroxypropanoate dehydrogenase [Nocardia amikacinitolerans]